MAKNEVDLLDDSKLVFKGRAISESADFCIPFFLIGALPAGVIAMIIGMVDSCLPGNFTGDAYLWSLIPFTNVLGLWPWALSSSLDSKLKDRGHERYASYWDGLKAFYRIPGRNSRQLLKKSYVRVSPSTQHNLHGKIGNMVVPMGEATHEVTDYLVIGFKGGRVERVIEPTPLMLWNDALKTVDEGFGLKKISA